MKDEKINKLKIFVISVLTWVSTYIALAISMSQLPYAVYRVFNSIYSFLFNSILVFLVPSVIYALIYIYIKNKYVKYSIIVLIYLFFSITLYYIVNPMLIVDSMNMNY